MVFTYSWYTAAVVIAHLERVLHYTGKNTTHFIYGYMASGIMVKEHSDSERGNPLPPHRLFFLLFLYSFICIIPQTG